MDKLAELVISFLDQGELTPEGILALKKHFAKLTGRSLPRHSDILSTYRRLLAAKKIQASKKFEDLLRLKKSRTLSGTCLCLTGSIHMS